MTPDRFFILIAGLFGAIGVALAAAASHGGGGVYAGTISSMLLFHAPAFLALGLSRVEQPKALIYAALLLLAGVVVFCGDLGLRGAYDIRLFPMAAPIGGTAMIAGWLAIAISAFWRPATR